MHAHDPETIAFYESEAPVYTASGKWGVARHLPAFLERLTPGATILELGCGGGVDAAFMIDSGFVVEPTDGVPAIAVQAELRLGRPVRVMRFDKLDADARYDAVVASACLLHVPRPALPMVLDRIRRALKPGGWHIASYKQGDGVEDRDGNGRYFNYFLRDDLIALYTRAGPWDVMDVTSYMGGGYDGVQRPWNAITVQKPR